MSDLAERFLTYDTENPGIWTMFERFANELVAAGVTTLSANLIFERMRWETAISGNDGYKLNNNYRAFYARMYEQKYPTGPNFRTRKSQADELL